MGLSRTVSEISCDCSRKFSPTYVLRPRLRNWRWGKNKNDGATRPNKKFDDIFTFVDTMHQHDRRTDRQTDRHRATAKTALMHRRAVKMARARLSIQLDLQTAAAINGTPQRVESMLKCHLRHIPFGLYDSVKIRWWCSTPTSLKGFHHTCSFE